VGLQAVAFRQRLAQIGDVIDYQDGQGRMNEVQRGDLELDPDGFRSVWLHKRHWCTFGKSVKEKQKIVNPP
jgi:hypothetical protein